MSREVYEYHSGDRTVHRFSGFLEMNSQNGITCIWSGRVVNDFDSIQYTWEFDWDELKKKGVDGLSGYIVARRLACSIPPITVKFDVELTEKCQIIEQTIVNGNRYNAPEVAFEYYLTPNFAKTVKDFDDEMFAASDKTDAILVIEEKKIHVNKTFLSFHSDFFTALFSSNFKEGQMTEIPIKDVSYEDFGLLLSTIYPKTQFPNDRTAEKLLELADRFLMPAVICQVEHHLLEHSNLENEKLMWLADAYSMPTLLEKMSRAMDTVEKAKAMQTSPEFGTLSDKAMAEKLAKKKCVVRFC